MGGQSDQLSRTGGKQELTIKNQTGRLIFDGIFFL